METCEQKKAYAYKPLVILRPNLNCFKTANEWLKLPTGGRRAFFSLISQTKDSQGRRVQF